MVFFVGKYIYSIFNLTIVRHFPIIIIHDILDLINANTGQLIYSFNGHDLDRGYPKPLTAIGLPSVLQKIDDIWVWGHNNQTFIFSGTKYWV